MRDRCLPRVSRLVGVRSVVKDGYLMDNDLNDVDIIVIVDRHAYGHA